MTLKLYWQLDTTAEPARGERAARNGLGGIAREVRAPTQGRFDYYAQIAQSAATPISIVMKMPPGSLPGMMSLARAPTTRPTISIQRICMVVRSFLDSNDCHARASSCTGTYGLSTAIQLRVTARTCGSPVLSRTAPRR